MNKAVWMALAVLLAGGVTALLIWRSGAPAGTALPGTEPYITGQVTRIEGGRILVEAVPGRQEGAKCWFAISAATRILREQGRTRVRAEAGDLTMGQRVKAWSNGPILESYPSQTGGAVIVITN